MWQRLMERIDDTMRLAAISLIFCLVKTVVQPSTRSLRNYLSMFLVSVPVGTLAGQVAHECMLSDSACFVATAIASLLAQDIVVAVLKNNNLVSRALDNLIDKITK